MFFWAKFLFAISLFSFARFMMEISASVYRYCASAFTTPFVVIVPLSLPPVHHFCQGLCLLTGSEQEKNFMLASWRIRLSTHTHTHTHLCRWKRDNASRSRRLYPHSCCTTATGNWLCLTQWLLIQRSSGRIALTQRILLCSRERVTGSRFSFHSPTHCVLLCACVQLLTQFFSSLCSQSWITVYSLERQMWSLRSKQLNIIPPSVVRCCCKISEKLKKKTHPAST
jgi:hypothetical protein